MADKKISQLTEKLSVELTDFIPIVDNTASPIETKYIKVSTFLISLGLINGEIGSQSVTTSGWSITFGSPLGTDVNGLDYKLLITCVDSALHSESIGYEITARTQNGFTIVPLSDAYVEFHALII